jgi:hypothetical protein
MKNLKYKDRISSLEQEVLKYRIQNDKLLKGSDELTLIACFELVVIIGLIIKVVTL